MMVACLGEELMEERLRLKQRSFCACELRSLKLLTGFDTSVHTPSQVSNSGVDQHEHCNDMCQKYQEKLVKQKMRGQLTLNCGHLRGTLG
jgi:hypothetical protein